MRNVKQTKNKTSKVTARIWAWLSDTITKRIGLANWDSCCLNDTNFKKVVFVFKRLTKFEHFSFL